MVAAEGGATFAAPEDMRIASALALSSLLIALAACDRRATDGEPLKPIGTGGGPPREVPMAAPGTPAPAGSEAAKLPGEDQAPLGPAPSTTIRSEAPGGAPGEAKESSGGSGAGAKGSKGQGSQLPSGFNDQGDQTRPEMGQKKIDLGPGDPKPNE